MSSISFKMDNVSIIEQDENNIKRNLIFSLSIDINHYNVVGVYGLNNQQYNKLASSLSSENFSGSISINNKPYHKNDIHYIPNDNIIFPFMNVYDNITLEMNKNKVNNRLKNVLEIVDLVGYEDTIPRLEESGFNYRIAIARAIYHSARVILFANPFNNLQDFASAELEKVIFNELPRIGIISIIPINNTLDPIIKKMDVIIVLNNKGELIKVVKMENVNSLTSILE